jgi:hypothetical protein
MRADTLSLILSQGSISAGKRVLIFDGAIGMVVGSAAYRMRGHGRILGVYGGQQPHFELVDSLNLDETTTNIIQSLASVELGPAAAYVRQHGFLQVVSENDARLEATAQASIILSKSKPSASMVENSNESEDEAGKETVNEDSSDDDDHEMKAPPDKIARKKPSNDIIKKPKRRYQSNNRHPAYIDLMQNYLRQGVER